MNVELTEIGLVDFFFFTRSDEQRAIDLRSGGSQAANRFQGALKRKKMRFCKNQKKKKKIREKCRCFSEKQTTRP